MMLVWALVSVSLASEMLAETLKTKKELSDKELFLSLLSYKFSPVKNIVCGIVIAVMVIISAIVSDPSLLGGLILAPVGGFIFKVSAKIFAITIAGVFYLLMAGWYAIKKINNLRKNNNNNQKPNLIKTKYNLNINNKRKN